MQMDLGTTIYNRILRIYKNAWHMRNLISELLDFRKQEQGYLKLKVEEQNLVTFTRQIYMCFYEYAQKKEITYRFDNVEETISVWFDSKQLQKVIFTAVKDMSLTLEKGKILAIVGSSGSGKSLLAHAVMGILPDNAKTGGTFYYKGEKLTKKKIEEIRGKKIAFIPQSISFLDPLMPVGEQVQGIQGKAVRELQEKLFKHFRLKEGTDKLYPFQLSGGMARRILLSTALVGNSELIIADEPTPGLDLDTAVKALQDFRSIANEGRGIILITHDIDLAIHIADSIAIFHDGRIIETADTSTFTGDGEGLKHPYSRALFAALPQNGFRLDVCPRCGACSATWEVDEAGMRCNCEHT